VHFRRTTIDEAEVDERRTSHANKRSSAPVVSVSASRADRGRYDRHPKSHPGSPGRERAVGHQKVRGGSKVNLIVEMTPYRVRFVLVRILVLRVVKFVPIFLTYQAPALVLVRVRDQEPAAFASCRILNNMSTLVSIKKGQGISCVGQCLPPFTVVRRLAASPNPAEAITRSSPMEASKS